MPTEDYGAISMKQSQLRSNSAQTSGDSVNAPLLDSTTSVFSDDDEDATSPNKNSKNDSAATCVKFFINLLSIPSKAANALNFEGLNSSPNSNPFHSRYGGTENENSNKFSRAFTTLLLTSSTAFVYTLTRCSFKGLVDASGPYRISIGVIVLICQLIITAFILLTKIQQERREIQRKKTKTLKSGQTASRPLISAIPPFQQYQLPPILKLMVAAFLDAFAFAMLLLSTKYVPPVLTVLLLQIEVPFGVVLGVMGGGGSEAENINNNQNEIENDNKNNIDDEVNMKNPVQNDGGDVEGGGRNSPPTPALARRSRNGYRKTHLIGASFVGLSIFLGVAPAAWALIFTASSSVDTKRTKREAINTFIFLVAGVVSSSSSHFKEKILTEVGKPVDPHYFCFTLGALQIICLLLLSPLFFPFQNIGSGETSNPYMEKNLISNLGNAWACLVDQENGDGNSESYELDEDVPRCEFVAPLIIAHVVGLVGVGGAVHVILGWGGGIGLFYRGLTAGVASATIVMAIYEIVLKDANYGVLVHSLHLACVIGVVIGLEVHNKAKLPGCEVVTRVEQTPEEAWEVEE